MNTESYPYDLKLSRYIFCNIKFIKYFINI